MNVSPPKNPINLPSLGWMYASAVFWRSVYFREVLYFKYPLAYETGHMTDTPNYKE